MNFNCSFYNFLREGVMRTICVVNSFSLIQFKHILLPLESYENFCFSILTYGRGFPRPFCSFPSTMCLHMACFNKQKIEALKLKFSITFKRQQYIPKQLQESGSACVEQHSFCPQRG